MGKFSYKKRKGTRKQSFKNRKKVKKGGGDGEDAAAAGTGTDTPADANVNVTGTGDNTTQVAAGVAAGQTDTATTDNTGDAAGVAPGQTVDPKAEAGQTDTNANKTGNEDVVQDWKEGQSEEDIKQAEQEVSNIEGSANDKGELDPDEMNKLVEQLAEGKDVPLWAKALAKSGAAGTAAKILNANPDLREAIKGRLINEIQNSGSGSTDAPGATNAGTDTNTGAAAPGGSYTADDAGYQTFVQKVQSDPEVLKNVVYVNNEMSQIFLKTPNGWTEIKK